MVSKKDFYEKEIVMSKKELQEKQYVLIRTLGKILQSVSKRPW